jgi:hypothetical protein
MEVSNPRNFEFPSHFGGIILRSIRCYRDHFFSYLILAALTYLPFLLIIQLSQFDLTDLVEFFHGHFLDIIIFLTLPTLLGDQRVLPFATISLFLQRFFASAVALCFIQLGTLFLFITFFAQIGFGVILIAIIPYIFLLFAGFFLIMENSGQLFSLRTNLMDSIRLVRSRFFSVFWNYLNITILMFLPLFFFSLWYFGRHPEMLIIRDGFKSAVENDLLLAQRFIETIQQIVQEAGFKWSRASLHVIFRPLKSLFLCFLFLGILQSRSPHRILGFFGQNPAVDQNTDASTENESQR